MLIIGKIVVGLLGLMLFSEGVVNMKIGSFLEGVIEIAIGLGLWWWIIT